MSRSAIRWAGAAALVVALVLGGRWWASDERRIHRAFDELLASVEKRGEETQLDRLAHARDFAAKFAKEFVVSARPYEGTITDRQQLMAILDGYRTRAVRVTARASGRELELRENGTADLFAVVEIDGSDSGGPGRERFRLRATWVSEDGEWRIGEVEVLERLESSAIFD